MPIVRAALSEGLATELSRLMAPSRQPLKIDTKKSLMTFLDVLVPHHVKWGTDAFPRSKPLERFIKEFEDCECDLYVITWKNQQLILRDIRTATLYVTWTQEMAEGILPSVQKRWLREYHMEGNTLVPRMHLNSMSEKLSLDGETYKEAAVRALRQELSIEPDPEYLKPPHFFRMSEYPHITGMWSRNKPEVALEHIETDQDIRETTRYPGILTRNQLEHFIWHMPPQYVRAEGYQEPKTNHHFFWEEVSQRGT